MNSTILITGGSGFLGRALGLKLREKYNVILASRNNGMNQYAAQATGCSVLPLDICNISSIKDVIKRYRPRFIIHAAATKFVDISENNPYECIDVNILGSQNVAKAAMEENVEAVIGISTDKAAPPVGNIYGHTKAIMERLFCSLDTFSSTSFGCIRFGNIAWSTGSVFPIWKQMTLNDRIIYSSGIGMRRFIFSVNEAVNLVETALENIQHLKGSILSVPMKSVEISDLLDVWCDIYSVPYEQIPRRKGDKIDEVLIGAIEAPYTEQIHFSANNYFRLDFGKNKDSPVAGEISTLNSSKMNREEIANLILNSDV